MDELEGVRGVTAAASHSIAVAQPAAVFTWGEASHDGAESRQLPVVVEELGEGVRVRDVRATWHEVFAIGEEAGELCSHGGENGCLGHDDMQDQASPKRIEALLGVRVAVPELGCLMRSPWQKTGWYTHGL